MAKQNMKNRTKLLDYSGKGAPVDDDIQRIPSSRYLSIIKQKR